MYRVHWELKELPFENVPDPRFFYASDKHQEALMRLLYAVHSRKGAAMLTGGVGCGKTVLSRILFSHLSETKYDVGLVTNPSLEPIELLREILYQLGIDPPERDRIGLLHALNEGLLNTMQQGKDTILIVDEAQAISEDATFEELRLLLNFQMNDRFLLTLILMGQPELKERVVANAQLDQRIGIRYHLQHLDMAETRQYMEFRLQRAGLKEGRKIFAPATYPLIYQHSQGIPRNINNICDMSLLSGYSLQLREIGPDLIEKVVRAGKA